MKIERLHIAHFGKFSDYTLAFEDGFSVFYGDNEDGKSTILECLRMLFYGSAGRGISVNPVRRYPGVAECRNGTEISGGLCR